MQISFGPSSDTYKAYAISGRPTVAGAAGAVTDVATFYRMTRARCFRGIFSVISFFAPLIASALLVVTTVALSSGTNWVGGVLDTIATATASDAKAGAADADQSGTAAAGQAAAPNKSAGDGEEDAIKAF